MLNRAAIALLLSFTLTSGVGAQGVGGLIKRKAAEVVKPKNEPAAKANEPAAPTSAAFPFDLTAESMEAFKRGLDVEISMRAEYRKEVAAMKSQAEYDKCTQEAAMSSDAQKVMEEYVTRSEKVKTQEEVQKLTVWQNEAIDAVLLKRCGQNPRPLIEAQTQRFTKAQFAGAVEFAKTFRKPSTPDQQPGGRESREECLELVLENDTAEAFVVCEIVKSVQEAPNASTDIKVLEYLKTIELVTKYCSLSKEMRADAVKNGIRVPGTGKEIYWVFSKEFANWVGDACDDVMKRILLLNK
jgi:hypothetical protein